MSDKKKPFKKYHKKNEEINNIDEPEKKSQYINLKKNGRLFYTWILHNFKKYRLPDVSMTNEDPCLIKETQQELHKYQKFLGEFMQYNSPFRDILIYHGLGSGKTVSAINIYNVLYNYTPGWNVFVLIKASLEDDPWLKDLKNWLTKDATGQNFNNIIFVHYDSPTADKQFVEAVKNADSSKKSMYIIDEAHNFISNVYSNLTSRSGRRAQIIYDHIIQDKYDNDTTRVLCISGTPAINNPFQLALLFNLLRPKIFPRSENEFNDLYISGGTYPILDPVKKNMFQRRIVGLVSYYIGATPDKYASKTIHYVDLPMSKYHQEIYEHFERIEDKLEKRRAGKQGSQVYRSYTRQACNFVFPHISQKIRGEDRPRPSKFRITESEAEKINQGKENKLKLEKGSEKIMKVTEYLEELQKYVTSFEQFLDGKNEQDKKDGYTLDNDIETYKMKYKGDFLKFVEKEKKKSLLFTEMYDCSPKMISICFNMLSASGPVVVYSNYVKMEGIQIFKIYLKYFGYSMFEFGKENTTTYAEYHGDIPMETRKKYKNIFNKAGNIHGDIIRAFLISPAGSEGINLENVRQVHILEPHWTEVKITQVIGRAIRQCSHKKLPLKERHVDVFRYKVARDKKQTTDQYIEELAKRKDNLVQSFLDAVKEAAIDCKLFKSHNMMATSYRCFQFEETTLFDKNIGPAYKDDIIDDVKIDNGLNSTKSMVKKIKVMKIKAVRKMLVMDVADEIKYTDPKFYWYYPESGMVYDYELDYPVGRIFKDNNGIPNKLDKDTYIIDQLIDIPEVEE